MKKIIFSMLCLVTLFFTIVTINPQAEGWGFSKGKDGNTPQIGRYQQIIEGTNSYYVGDTNKKEVYLTFDAGYDNGILNGILDTLTEKGVKSSFFITGDFVNRFPDLTKRIANDGHIVGNHSYSHHHLPKMTNDEIEKDLKKLEDAYFELTKAQMPKFFRPPAGEFNRSSLEFINQLGYKTIFWSLAYKDWDVNKQPTAEYAINQVLDNLHNGAIILLHTVSSTNSEILPRLIDEIRSQGYEFKTLYDL